MNSDHKITYEQLVRAAQTIVDESETNEDIKQYYGNTYELAKQFLIRLNN